MQDFIREVSIFLDSGDIKMLNALAKDVVVSSSIVKIFENPEKSGKFFTLIKNRPTAIYLTAKIAERISKYLNKEEANRCFELFLNSIKMLKDNKDKKIEQKTFLLLKEAMDRRIEEEKLEELAILLSEFYNPGFKNYLDKLLFLTIVLAEKGDYKRAVNILSLINLDSTKKLKYQILIEWAKSVLNQEKAMEILKNVPHNEDIALELADAYASVGDFENAVKICLNDKKILYKIVKILKSWSENFDADDALEMLKLALRIAIEIDDKIAEDILNSITKVLERKIKENIDNEIIS